MTEGPVTRWVDEVKRRIENDWDACAVLVGYTGVGKSTLAWMLAERFGPMANERMCLSADEVWDTLKTAERGDVVVVDEGVEVLYSLDTVTRESRDFVRWLDVCRARGVILLICMANLRWVNARVREDRALWAFSVRARGRAVMYERRGGDPMSLDGEGAGRFRAVGKVKFGRVSGSEWDKYQARKNERVRDYDPAREREEKREKRRAERKARAPRRRRRTKADD